MYGYIYKTINLVNKMIYIGQKKSKVFLGNKYFGSGKRLHEAIRKYGERNFTVELIEEVADEKDMDEREIYWINKYNSTNLNIGYNICEGGRVNRTCRGDNNPSKRLEVRKKISETHKRLFKEGKAKIPSRLGMHNTEESKKKQSENAKINPNYGMRGKKTSEETKQKIRLAVTGKPKKSKGYIHITNDIEDRMIPESLFPEYEKLGWRKGRKKFSDKACKNISKGHKGLKTSLGKIWITKDNKSKTIDKEELDYYIKLGWRKGRIIIKNV